jgi:hypothetical protein
MSRVTGETFGSPDASYPYVDYSYTQSVSGNYTDVSFTFGMHFGTYNFRTDARTLDWAAVSGSGTGSYSYGPTGTGPYPEGSDHDEVTYKSGTFRLTHNSAGVGKATLSFSIAKTYSGSDTLSKSTTITFPTIPRQPGAPGTPTVTGHTDSDPTTATISWTAPSNVGAGLSQRQVQVSTNSAFSTTVIDNTAAWGTSFAATGLAKATTYYVRVRASSSAGFGAWSGTATFTTGTTVPGVLAVPTASAVDYTSVTLAWSAPADTGGSAVTSYSIERATDAAFTTGHAWNTVTGTSATISGLSHTTTYYWRIAATNAVGTGAYSSTLTQATQTATAPSAPAAPTLSGVGGTSLTVNWVAPSANGSAITGYTVQYSTSAAFTTSTSISGLSASATSASVTGLSYGTTYYFRVLAINALGTTTGAATNTITGTTVPFAPDAPAVSNIGQTTATVSYVAPANGGVAITGYDIQRATDAAFTANTAISPDLATPLDITGLEPGITHYVRVRAINANGTGPWSAATSFVSLPSAWVRNADNTAWVGAQVYQRIGTAWVLCTTQKRNGSTWV